MFVIADENGVVNGHLSPEMAENQQIGGEWSLFYPDSQNSRVLEDDVLEGDEMLNLWRDFLKVVEFIDSNAAWLSPMLRLASKITTKTVR